MEIVNERESGKVRCCAHCGLPKCGIHRFGISSSWLLDAYLGCACRVVLGAISHQKAASRMALFLLGICILQYTKFSHASNHRSAGSNRLGSRYFLVIAKFLKG